MKEKPLHLTIQNLRPSATLVINEQSKAMINEGKKVYRLGFGQSPFPVPDSVVTALQKHAPQKDYLPVRGLLELREAVARFNKRKIGLDSSPEDILIGPGSKELIFNLQMAFDGDLLIPSPSWVSYQPQASMLGKKVWWIDTKEEDNWSLNPEAVDEICAQIPAVNKLLVLNYPSNPTGGSYDSKQLQALADAFRRNNVLVIADEIYGELHHSIARDSLSKYYPEGTIISEGLSKWCGAGGWRLGTFTFPKNYRWLQDAMATIASETFSAVSAPIQYAAIEAFNGNEEIDQYLENSKTILRVVGNYVFEKLQSLQITMSPSVGGFYLFPNFKNHKTFLAKKGIHNSTQLCETLLLETGIALLPGEAFGRPSKELTARLSFVDFNGKAVLESLAKGENPNDPTFIKKQCPQIFNSMAALEKWLQG